MKFPTFQSQEEVPEAFRDSYVEKDGEWIFDDAKLGDGGKAALDAERKARRDAERVARDLERRIAELEDKLTADGKLDDDGLAELREKVEARVRGELQGELDSLRAENRSMKLDDQVRKLALANGVMSDRVDAWWKLHGDKFDLDESGGIVVKDDASASPAGTIAKELKEASPFLYEGSKIGGGGSPGSGGGKGKSGVTHEELLKNPGAVVHDAREAAGA